MSADCSRLRRCVAPHSRSWLRRDRPPLAFHPALRVVELTGLTVCDSLHCVKKSQQPALSRRVCPRSWLSAPEHCMGARFDRCTSRGARVFDPTCGCVTHTFHGRVGPSRSCSTHECCLMRARSCVGVLASRIASRACCACARSGAAPHECCTLSARWVAGAVRAANHRTRCVEVRVTRFMIVQHSFHSNGN